MDNLRDEMKKIIEVVMGMEFNEAAYQRKYSGIKSPMKRMFTPVAIEQAVATLFRTCGLNEISKSGFAQVVEQILVDNSCVLLAADSPGEKASSLSISFPVKPGYSRSKKRKAREEPRLLCNKEARKLDEPEKKPEEEEPPLQVEEENLNEEELPELDDDDDDYVDITDVEDMEIDREDGSNELSTDSDPGVYEFCLVADDVPGDLTAEEIRELVQSLSEEELEVVPDDRPLVEEARRVENQVFLAFTSMLLAELVLDAFTAAGKTIRGSKVALRRGYSQELEFLARSFTMQTEFLARLVYVSGLSGDADPDSGSSKVDKFRAMLSDASNPSPIKSTLVLPGKREMILELSTDLQADLLMYRSESGISKQLAVCRSMSYMPRVIRCPEDCSPDDASWLAAVAQKLTSREPEGPELPPGFEDTEKHKGDPEPRSKPDSAIVSPAEAAAEPVRRDKHYQRTLVVKCLRAGYNLHELRCFFPTAIAAHGLPDEARIEFASEAAADEVMNAYVHTPQEFFSEEFALFIVRSPGYVRPGQVNKRDERPANQRPSRVLVAGISSALPDNVVRGALAELLDRELARDPSVTEYGAVLLRESHRKGELFLLTFYTRAAVRALVSLDKPLRFAGRMIRFSLESGTEEDLLEYHDTNEDSDDDTPDYETCQRQLVVWNPGPGTDPVQLKRFIRAFLPPGDDRCYVEILSNSMMLVILGSEEAADELMDAYVSEPNDFRFGSSGLCIYRDRNYVRPGSVSRYRRSPVDETPAVFLASNLPLVKGKILSGVLCELLGRALKKNPRICREGVGFLRNFVAVKGRNQEYLVTLYSREAVHAVLSMESSVVIAGKKIWFSLPEEEDHPAKNSVFDKK